MPLTVKPFRFKQFEILQSRSAMRVGTDSVLLGAWVKLNGSRHILDVGTGTGVIALICAQRFPYATIEAVEIDEASADEACENFSNSPWQSRLKIHHGDFLKIVSSERFDVVISNPPYFTDSLRASDPIRNAARHDDYLPSDLFMKQAKKIMTPDGVIALIFPKIQLERWSIDAGNLGLKPRRVCQVFTLGCKDASRVMIEFSVNAPAQPFMDSLLLRKNSGEFSEAYKLLTAELYTKL